MPFNIGLGGQGGLRVLEARQTTRGSRAPHCRPRISAGPLVIRAPAFGTLLKQIDSARKRLENLIKLTTRYEIQPCVHVHSGDILANGGSILYLILKDFDPKTVGAYVDPMHMTVEGGLSGWEMGLDLVAPWVSLVGISSIPGGRVFGRLPQLYPDTFQRCRFSHSSRAIPFLVQKTRCVF